MRLSQRRKADKRMGMIKAIESYLLKKINIDRYLPLQLDITNLCNLRCIHCYHPHHKNEGAISLADWKLILDQYKKLISKMHYRPWVMICGGEPLVSPFLFPILDFIQSELPSSKVSILTNGTLIGTQTIEKLKNYKNLNFQVSLDGPDSNRHDIIRGQGNFHKAMSGIDLLIKNGFDVNVLSVLTKNTSLWVEDFFKLAKAKKFQSMNFVRFIPEGYGRRLLESSEDEPLIGLELKNVYQKIIHFMVKYQVKSKTQAPLFNLIIPGLGRSGRFWEGIVVDYQGFVVASSRSRLKLGHALTDGIENIFLNHDIFKSLRKGNVESCGKCPHFNVCGGDRNAAFAATGNFLGVDPACWIKEELNFKQSEGTYEKVN